MKIAEVVSQDNELFGPIFHRTNTLRHFKDFDFSNSSKSAVLGPAIYASFGSSNWNPSHLTTGHVLTGYVRGKIIDISKPLPHEDLARLSSLIGRPVDHLPVISLERQFGSVAAGLKQAGYSAAIHMGPGSAGTHIAVFDPSDIVEV